MPREMTTEEHIRWFDKVLLVLGQQINTALEGVEDLRDRVTSLEDGQRSRLDERDKWLGERLDLIQGRLDQLVALQRGGASGYRDPAINK